MVPIITTSIAYVADESAPLLYAQYSNNFFYKDSIAIKTDESGLLTTTEGQSEDKSLVVVENLLLTVLEAAKIAIPSETITKSLNFKKLEKQPEIHITFDPTNKEEMKSTNDKLLILGLELKEGLRSGNSYKAIDISFDDKCKYSGLLFRPFRFYRLYQVVNKKEGVEKKLVVSFAVPDPTQHYCVPLKRKVFVVAKTKLEIENGMLRGLSIEKGSELEAISGLPVRLLKEIVSLPRGILIYQSDQIKAETDLINSQTLQIKALQDLEKAKQTAQQETGQGVK